MGCRHLDTGYICLLGLYDGKPDARDCAQCEKYETRTPEDGGKTGQKPDMTSMGLGDTVAKITSFMGIKPCGGCKKRQEGLNKMIRYGRSKKKEQHGTHNVADTPDDGQEDG